MKQSKGVYIVLEGSDGAGKTTQAVMLYKRLVQARKNVADFMVAEPGRVYNVKTLADLDGMPSWSDREERAHSKSVAGYDLRQYIKHSSHTSLDATTRVLLHTASHRITWTGATEDALMRDQIVISTRGWLSSLIFQGYGDGVDHTIIENVHRAFIGDRYVEPDIHIVLTTLDNQHRSERLKERNAEATRCDVYESREDSFQARVLEGYEKSAEMPGVFAINAIGTKEDIHNNIWQHVTLKLQEKQGLTI